jgi:hypothetical protein
MQTRSFRDKAEEIKNILAVNENKFLTDKEGKIPNDHDAHKT